jgi:hypothetical protein
MDIVKLRAWWAHRQGLDGSLDGKPAAEVLERTGWARSVGGAGPYLGLFARSGQDRESVDAAVAAQEIHELPSARGCTYVLPAADFALGLAVAKTDQADMKAALKLGVTEGEVERLCGAVLRTLEDGPLDPDQLKNVVGPAVRNLGTEGQKKGLSSTMPLALGRLQVAGHIRRIPVNGRLDQQRYKYALWMPNPLATARMGIEEAYVELARRYFGWIGPATLAEFQWFSGLGAKAARAAVEPLTLVPFGDDPARLMSAGDREKYENFQVPKKPRYSLVGSLDGIALLRRNLTLLLSAEEQGRAVAVEKGQSRPLGLLSDLPSHAILDRGRIVGLWEYDPARGSIAWAAFIAPDTALREAVKRMEEYVRAQLGDARSFSLDSPKSRAPRIDALRSMQP